MRQLYRVSFLKNTATLVADNDQCQETRSPTQNRPASMTMTIWGNLVGKTRN